MKKTILATALLIASTTAFAAPVTSPTFNVNVTELANAEIVPVAFQVTAPNECAIQITDPKVRFNPIQVGSDVVDCVFGRIDNVARDFKGDVNRFTRKEYTNTSFRLKIVTHRDVDDLRKTAASYGMYDSEQMAAFSVIQPKSNVCTIHIVDPNRQYTPKSIGHEFYHCVYGHWHAE